MDLEKLEEHIKLCEKNLKSSRVKCCANCPFEDEIVHHSPGLKVLFTKKRKEIRLRDFETGKVES